MSPKPTIPTSMTLNLRLKPVGFEAQGDVLSPVPDRILECKGVWILVSGLRV